MLGGAPYGFTRPLPEDIFRGAGNGCSTQCGDHVAQNAGKIVTPGLKYLPSVQAIVISSSAAAAY